MPAFSRTFSKIGQYMPDVNSGGFGVLYNHYTTSDVRKLFSSDDWGLATRAEWESLALSIGASPAIKIIDPSLLYWLNVSTNTNELKLNIRGSGERTNIFQYLKIASKTWTATNGLYGVTSRYYLELTASPSHNFTFSSDNNNLWRGYGIRSIRSSTVLSEGDESTYTGNDGTIYRTVCINGREWLADNLAETKFRNGESIPVVTDATAWVALTTAGMCYYDNDPTNA